MEKAFINEAYDYAIKMYLREKKNKEGIKYNSFAVVVIRLLNIIYDELDILTPFQLNDESIFYSNLQKYGYSLENIIDFNNTFLSFYQNENKKDFIKIQKMLIDMYAKKKISLNVSEEEINRFKGLLYTPNAKNPLIASYNFLMSDNPNEILDYCNESFDKNNKMKIEKAKETLSYDAYETLKISLSDIEKMSAEELESVNKQVYNHFSINENAINKDYLLDKAINEIKNPKPVYSTGNGYVDILFILAIIATLIMIIFIITLIIT